MPFPRLHAALDAARDPGRARPERTVERLPERAVEQAVALGRDGAARGWVGLARGARRLARATGALGALDRRRDRPLALYLRSLLAVHDIDELDRLDLAWWTFAAVARTDTFLARRGGRAQVFEYGAGASTLWLARRARRVVTVEHDGRWWPDLAARLSRLPNVEAALVPPEPSEAPACPSGRAGWGGMDFSTYVRAIRPAGGPFDLVVIDGRARPSCLAEAAGHLAPGGMILFDNADRRRYAAAIAASGLAVERLAGRAPAQPFRSHTALLAREAATLREA